MAEEIAEYMRWQIVSLWNEKKLTRREVCQYVGCKEHLLFDRGIEKRGKGKPLFAEAPEMLEKRQGSGAHRSADFSG